MFCIIPDTKVGVFSHPSTFQRIGNSTYQQNDGPWAMFSVPTSITQYPIHLIDQQLWWVQWPPQSASLEDWPVAFYLTSVCLPAPAVVTFGDMQKPWWPSKRRRTWGIIISTMTTHLDKGSQKRFSEMEIYSNHFNTWKIRKSQQIPTVVV